MFKLGILVITLGICADASELVLAAWWPGTNAQFSITPLEKNDVAGVSETISAFYLSPPLFSG